MINEMNKKCIREYKAIVQEDIFKIRPLIGENIGSVIDIGANIGIFSVLASQLFPEAEIVSIEPCKEIFEVLQRNTDSMPNINCSNIALGEDGYSKTTLNNNFPVASISEPCEIEEEGHVLSCSLPVLLDTLPKGEFVLKLDCEGAEKHLIGDKDSEDIMKRAIHIGMEVHFKCEDPKSVNFAEWEDFNSWIHDIFTDTHSILYYKSSKKRGYGHYILSRNS